MAGKVATVAGAAVSLVTLRLVQQAATDRYRQLVVDEKISLWAIDIAGESPTLAEDAS